MKIVIVGGGVIGLCSAYYLQKEGHEITVIDKGNITDGTSFGNAGYISPSHFIPLASPGMVLKGLKWMMSSSSPFYIKPRLNADLARWSYTFWRNANEKTMNRNIPHLHNILQLSRDLTSQIKDDLGNHFRMEEKGILMLYKEPKTEKHEIELARKARELSIEARVYSAIEVQDLEPEVEVNVRGGVLYPGDCHLHPGDFMKTLKDHLEKNKVEFRLNSTVTGFEKSGDKVNAVLIDEEKIDCDELVLATGSWLPLVSSQLGIRLLLQAGKGYSMTFENVQPNLHYPAILIDNRVAMTPWGNTLRMGGTMEINEIDSAPLPQRAKAIFNAAHKYYPNLPVTFPTGKQAWSGLRPLSPDGLPYIGRHSKYKNLVIASGHAMLGMSLCAATGKLVEEIIDNQETSIEMKAFHVERFG